MKEHNFIKLCYEMHHRKCTYSYLEETSWNLILTDILSLADWLKRKNKQIWQMFLKTEELGKVYCYSCELFFSFLPSKLTNF